MRHASATGNGAASPGKDKLLVTGAAGFIGSHLVERLLEDDHEVWGLDNFDPVYPPAVKRGNLRTALRHPHMHLVEGDLRDAVLLDGLFGDRSFDAVLHLAAHRGALSSAEDPELCYQVNLMGTVNLLEAMRRAEVDRMVFTSDRSVYGHRDGGRTTESDPADRPLTAFAAAKRSVELLCHVHHRMYGASVHALRLSTVYGPREEPDSIVHRLARHLAGSGTVPASPPVAEGDYLYVSDAVEGIVASLERLLAAPAEEPVFEIMNLGGVNVLRADELVERVAAALDVEPPAEVPAAASTNGDRPSGAVDSRRAAELLGFRPEVGMDEGLERFVDWLSDRAGSRSALEATEAGPAG